MGTVDGPTQTWDKGLFLVQLPKAERVQGMPQVQGALLVSTLGAATCRACLGCVLGIVLQCSTHKGSDQL